MLFRAISGVSYGLEGKRALFSRGQSAPLTPCDTGLGLGGGGAEWRGRQRRDRALETATGDAFLRGGGKMWIEPPNTRWGANVHVIDLRSVASVRDAVQCNCEAYAKRGNDGVPLVPVDLDGRPSILMKGREGGGVQCCGDRALGPLLPGADPRGPKRAVSLLYNVTYLVMPTDGSVPDAVPERHRELVKRVPLEATLMVSSAADVDGAACFGEFNARPCGGVDSDGSPEAIAAERAAWDARAARRGDNAPEPRNQTCDVVVDAETGEETRVSVAWSHPFTLPAGTAYDVYSAVGHQHVGGRNVRLINVTYGADNAVVCQSDAAYGNAPGVVGDEAGFLVDIVPCVFDPPARLSAGESYVLRSEYDAVGVARRPRGPGFRGPYEGVMGYMTMVFTIPEGFDIGVFSASGDRVIPPEEEEGAASVRTLENDEDDKDAAAGSGACVVAAKAAAANAADEEATPWTSIQLSEDANFTMAYRFVDDDENVQFRLRREKPAWVALGIHRPGGDHMAAADYVVAESADDGETFAVYEAYTMAYAKPTPKRDFPDGDARDSGLNATDCAVVATDDGVVEVTFTRAATVAEGDPYGANVSRGVATEVIWAAGEDGAGFEMDYHGQVRGHLEVTF